MFTEQSQSTLDKFEMEVIFGGPGFLHFLGTELFFSGFYERNINSLIRHQSALNSIMFGTDTKWLEIDKNGPFGIQSQLWNELCNWFVPGKI